MGEANQTTRESTIRPTSGRPNQFYSYYHKPNLIKSSYFDHLNRHLTFLILRPQIIGRIWCTPSYPPCRSAACLSFPKFILLTNVHLWFGIPPFTLPRCRMDQIAYFHHARISVVSNVLMQLYIYCQPRVYHLNCLILGTMNDTPLVFISM